MRPTDPEICIKVFISYAHEDQELHHKLKDHLRSLERSGKIKIWQDQEIPAGANGKEKINTRLNEADLILLLVNSASWPRSIVGVRKYRKPSSVIEPELHGWFRLFSGL